MVGAPPPLDTDDVVSDRFAGDAIVLPVFRTAPPEDPAPRSVSSDDEAPRLRGVPDALLTSAKCLARELSRVKTLERGDTAGLRAAVLSREKDVHVRILALEAPAREPELLDIVAEECLPLDVRLSACRSLAALGGPPPVKRLIALADVLEVATLRLRRQGEGGVRARETALTRIGCGGLARTGGFARASIARTRRAGRR